MQRTKKNIKGSVQQEDKIVVNIYTCNDRKLYEAALPFVAIAEVPLANMKFNPFVTSDQSKNCKRHLSAPSHIRRKIMSFPLSKELRWKYKVRSVPIRKGDGVQVVRGHYEGQQIGKLTQVCRKRRVLYIEPVQQEKADGPTLCVAFTLARWLSLD